MSTPEEVINTAWIGGEKCMRDKVLSELKFQLRLREVRGLDCSADLSIVIQIVQAIELTKVEQ